MPAPPAADWALDLHGVSKVFKGKVHALRGIDLKVRRGEVFGLLGPNGAGKSTLVKILMTVIKPSAASGTLLGKPVADRSTLARVGYLPEHHRFPEYLTGAQVVDFYGALAGVPRAQRIRRRDELIDLVAMRDWANAKVKGYSKGMRQRIGIAQALVNQPDLVLLDEPTDGVDPVGRRDIREILLRLKRAGTTVFLNSHLLSELEMVCDRVAILVQGKVASQGTIDELTIHRRYYEIEIVAEPGAQAAERFRAAVAIEPAHSGPPGAPTRPAPSFEGRLPSGQWARCENSTLRVGTDDPGVIAPIIDALRARSVVIRAVRPVRPSLEDLFMEAVTDPGTGRALSPGAAIGPRPGPMANAPSGGRP